MPLTNSDMQRLRELGYVREDFSARTQKGWVLRNNRGKCFFLADDRCSVYHFRPEGCRLYPLVYDENVAHPILDRFCPHRDEFTPQEADVRRLLVLLKRLGLVNEGDI